MWLQTGAYHLGGLAWLIVVIVIFVIALIALIMAGSAMTQARAARRAGSAYSPGRARNGTRGHETARILTHARRTLRQGRDQPRGVHAATDRSPTEGLRRGERDGLEHHRGQMERAERPGAGRVGQAYHDELEEIGGKKIASWANCSRSTDMLPTRLIGGPTNGRSIRT